MDEPQDLNKDMGHFCNEDHTKSDPPKIIGAPHYSRVSDYTKDLPSDRGVESLRTPTGVGVWNPGGNRYGENLVKLKSLFDKVLGELGHDLYGSSGRIREAKKLVAFLSDDIDESIDYRPAENRQHTAAISALRIGFSLLEELRQRDYFDKT